MNNSFIHRKLRDVLESRIIKFFSDQAKKDPEKYLKFHEDYGLFFREGIVTTGDQAKRVSSESLEHVRSVKPSSEFFRISRYYTIKFNRQWRLVEVLHEIDSVSYLGKCDVTLLCVIQGLIQCLSPLAILRTVS